MSFRRRITLVSAAAVAIAVIVGSALTYVLVRNQLRGQIDSSLRGFGVAIQTSSKKLGPGVPGADLVRRRPPNAGRRPPFGANDLFRPPSALPGANQPVRAGPSWGPCLHLMPPLRECK